jgi:hypothetical protein
MKLTVDSRRTLATVLVLAVFRSWCSRVRFINARRIVLKFYICIQTTAPVRRVGMKYVPNGGTITQQDDGTTLTVRAGLRHGEKLNSMSFSEVGDRPFVLPKIMNRIGIQVHDHGPHRNSSSHIP